jgi:hypothetical protein
MTPSLSRARRGDRRRVPRVGAVQPPQGSSCECSVAVVAWPSVPVQAYLRRDPAVQGAVVRGGWARACRWRGET